MSDFIKIKSYYHDDIEDVDRIESMWAIPSGELYRLDNAPFYVLGYSLGDIVQAKEINGELFIDFLVEASGNSNIHVVFYDMHIVQKIREELDEMGCSSELSNIPSLISLNVPRQVDYSGIKAYLKYGVEQDWWDYQEACLAH